VIPENESPGSVILALHRATHATLHALIERLAGLDLPAADINVLANLADGAGRTVGALAAATATRPSTLTSLLDRLTRRGFVVRETDPADRRSFVVLLTPAGRAAAERAAAAIADLERQALAAVTPAQRAGFHTLIDALTQACR
jgi:MarR family transcriptional regulator, organic hydroperoxide resistance regulator